MCSTLQGASHTWQSRKQVRRYQRHLRDLRLHVSPYIRPSAFGNPTFTHSSTDEPFKAAAQVWETVSDPDDGLSGEPDATAMARAFGVRESVWKIMTRPENAHRLRRFNIAMAGSANLQPANVVLGGELRFKSRARSSVSM